MIFHVIVYGLGIEIDGQVVTCGFIRFTGGFGVIIAFDHGLWVLVFVGYIGLYE